MINPTKEDDKILNFDFHLAVCFLAIEQLTEALNDFYTSTWLMVSGDDAQADAVYRTNYRVLLRMVADGAHAFEVTDEFRKQYQDEQNAHQD